LIRRRNIYRPTLNTRSFSEEEAGFVCGTAKLKDSLFNAAVTGSGEQGNCKQSDHSVAQIFNLLYRRFATCTYAPGAKAVRSLFALRLEIGDTAD